MILSELLAFLEKVGAKPKKSLSQNFLIDPNITRKIVQTASVKENDFVLEIGPGPGALTETLLQAGAKVYAVELDSVFAKELYRFQNGKLTVYEGDFLKFPLKQLPDNLKVVANLPYHITTPILEKLFAHSFSNITVMVQKEVAQRMMAKAGTKDFGALSLFIQFYANIGQCFTVPPSCFYPKPAIDSAVIRLDAKTVPDIDADRFFSIVHSAFQKRRKMLTSSLNFPKDLIKQALCDLNIREDARPEMLSLEQWVSFVKKLERSAT
jgi:16S rRNA (adenine1518-N6/adenine1519-N6)-dimethyltransferase